MTKQTKMNAATVAAPKKAAVRVEVRQYVDQIEHVQQSLNATLYEAAMWCRENSATSDELDELLAVIDKRKRSDFKRIVSAPEEVVTKSMPANLVQAAQFIRARVKGANAQLAKSYATGKTDAKTLATKLGQEPAEQAGRKAGDTHEADKAAPAPEDVGNLARLNDLLPKLEAEMAEYGPECRKAFAAWKAATEAMMKAAANG